MLAHFADTMNADLDYVLLRQVHLGAVTASLLLFAARGLGVLAGARWPLSPLPRWGSVAIDTVLLTAGVGLWVRLGLNPVKGDAWLGLKLLLLVVYVVLGSLALKRARRPAARRLAFAGALACVGLMVGMARAHHPAGWWWLLVARP